MREIADYLIALANAPQRTEIVPENLLAAAHAIESLDAFMRDVAAILNKRQGT